MACDRLRPQGTEWPQLRDPRVWAASSPEKDRDLTVRRGHLCWPHFPWRDLKGQSTMFWVMQEVLQANGDRKDPLCSLGSAWHAHTT